MTAGARCVQPEFGRRARTPREPGLSNHGACLSSSGRRTGATVPKRRKSGFWKMEVGGGGVGDGGEGGGYVGFSTSTWRPIGA